MSFWTNIWFIYGFTTDNLLSLNISNKKEKVVKLKYQKVLVKKFKALFSSINRSSSNKLRFLYPVLEN